ncbi:hypothetical protein [Nonomuraea dietziae]|uniref:hypothetical protein n=1 Tax=Nonomuraea dietziae TaxID=65515 RepID=UPI0034299073
MILRLMDDDEIPHGITRQEWTAMAAEDRLLLLLGADRAQTPEEWAEATRKAADAYSEWMTIRE